MTSMNTTYVSESTDSISEMDRSSHKAFTSLQSRFDTSATSSATLRNHDGGSLSVHSYKSGKSNTTVMRVRKVRPPPLLLQSGAHMPAVLGYSTLAAQGQHGDSQAATLSPLPPGASPFLQLEIESMPSFSSYTSEHAAAAKAAAKAAALTAANDRPTPTGQRPPLSPLPTTTGPGSLLEAARSHRPSDSLVSSSLLMNSTPLREHHDHDHDDDEEEVKREEESGSSRPESHTNSATAMSAERFSPINDNHSGDSDEEEDEDEEEEVSDASVHTENSSNHPPKGPRRRRRCRRTSPAGGLLHDATETAGPPSLKEGASVTLAPESSASLTAIALQLRYELRIKKMELVQDRAQLRQLEATRVAVSASLQAKERDFGLRAEEVETRERQFMEQATRMQSSRQARAAYLQQLRLSHSALQVELESARVELNSLAARVAQSEEEKKRMEEHRTLTNRKMVSLEGTLPVEQGFLVETQRQAEQQEADLAAKEARVVARREDVRRLREEVTEMEAAVERLQMVAEATAKEDSEEGERDWAVEEAEGNFPLSARTAEAAERLRTLTELERDMDEVRIAQNQRAALEAYLCSDRFLSSTDDTITTTTTETPTTTRTTTKLQDYDCVLEEQKVKAQERYDDLMQRLEQALQWSEDTLVNARAELYLVRSRR